MNVYSIPSESCLISPQYTAQKVNVHLKLYVQAINRTGGERYFSPAISLIQSVHGSNTTAP
jgi:hypothetical protein